MGLQHLDTMLKAMARPVQLFGGWGFIISWLYRGIGINFEMAFLSPVHCWLHWEDGKFTERDIISPHYDVYNYAAL